MLQGPGACWGRPGCLGPALSLACPNIGQAPSHGPHPGHAPALWPLHTKEKCVGGKCRIRHWWDPSWRLAPVTGGPAQGLVSAFPFPATLARRSGCSFYPKCRSLPVPQQTRLRPLSWVIPPRPPQPLHRPGAVSPLPPEEPLCFLCHNSSHPGLVVSP